MTPVQACNELVASFLPAPPPSETNDAQEDGNNDDRSQYSPSNLLLDEQFGETQKKKRADEEDSDDVNRRDRLGSAGPLSKFPGSIQRNPTHEGNGVPDDDTSNVEEQVGKSDLKGSNTIRYQGSEQTSDCCTNVGSKSKRKHLCV